MNKYTIIGVIALMSVSLLGVVGLQLYWINDAIEVKQAQFEQAVNSALTSTVDKLETEEALAVVTGKMATLQHLPAPDTLIKEVIQAEPLKHTPKQAPSKAPELQKEPKPKAKSKPTLADNTERPEVRKVGPGSIVYHPKGSARVRFLSGDSIPLTEFKAQGKKPVKYVELNGKVKPASDMQVQVYTYVTDEIRQPHTVQRINVQTDSVLKLAKTYRRSFNFSVDTLQMLASMLDSLHQFTHFATTINPADLEAVQVRNDSVFITRKGQKRPVHVNQQRRANIPAVPFLFRQPEAFRIYGQDAQAIVEGHKHSRAIAEAQKKEAQTLVAAQASRNANKAAKATITQPLQPTKTTIEKLEHKKEKLNNVVQKMVVEYVAKDEPLQKRLNLESLPLLLKDELKQQGIDLPFGYHVVSGQNDTLLVKHAAKQDNVHYYAAALFPNDLIQKKDYLAVYFPDSSIYAIQSLWGMMALSGFFTLIIIATFGTTIHIIYKQKKLSEMKNDFINNMTHEFKTPIATISLATDSIANPKIYENPDKIKYYTNIIRQENKRMNTQVENVLQIALLEKNEFKMRLAPVDVHLLIVKAIESIRLQVEQRLGSINVQLDALAHELKSDEIHLYNVICNLLDNANKYSPAAPEISLSTRNVDGGIVIAVDDKGMGMSKDTQQRVFEKFYRVPTGNLHNVKGFGLGLSYVKAIVQAHHGNINLWSEPGKGSRFEIFLPFRKES
ncbi:sensor histidine kinase [Pontibacter burrus]|uniref:histidine kinase n=1 Tax=Pontibacter burrus TaxID=2704466 RepID=A0A6B3LZV9_9BACT|nr:HAMP domain-containing sensor histidine kinase [Pontibacter burrus]NEM99208.1 HAMP domain-containing histidine kinase [Pontibacter burrus]